VGELEPARGALDRSRHLEFGRRGRCSDPDIAALFDDEPAAINTLGRVDVEISRPGDREGASARRLGPKPETVLIRSIDLQLVIAGYGRAHHDVAIITTELQEVGIEHAEDFLTPEV